jgi:hypothetical protein
MSSGTNVQKTKGRDLARSAPYAACLRTAKKPVSHITILRPKSETALIGQTAIVTVNPCINMNVTHAHTMWPPAWGAAGEFCQDAHTDACE